MAASVSSGRSPPPSDLPPALSGKRAPTVGWGTRLSRTSRVTANWGLVALIAVAIGVPIALAYSSGAMKIPRIDDWAFARVAVDLYSPGHFRLVGWGEMTMIGHELWGLPFIALFGHSITVLHWAGVAA